MPFTVEEKRELRTKQALAAGKAYKATVLKKRTQKLLCKPQNTHMLVGPDSLLQGGTAEQEMNPTRMEVEDLCQ